MNNSKISQSIWQVILASSAGTLIEWYDFYIFGSLSAIIAQKFFPPSNPDLAYIATLATFAVGFIVRPFGAIVFGRLGDLTGRKYTFLLTLLIMGGSTFAIGLVPGYDSIGMMAPIIVLLLRLLQGLALGGEYGGAATYVAEHSPHDQRGYYTSFIQTTATLGLFVSLAVILLTRSSLTPEDFNAWGWRIPFWLSILLVVMSYYIRIRLKESPLFAKLKSEGKTSLNPIKESFGKKENLRLVLLALFGAAMGQGVIWYTGQFYALSFLQKTMQVEFVQSNIIIAVALLLGTPFFIYFGKLSDKIGRKKIMMTGMLIAALAYYPIYAGMDRIGDLSKKTEDVPRFSIENSISRNDKMQNIEKSVKTTTYTDGAKYRETTISTDGKTETIKEVIVSNTQLWQLILLVFIQVVFVTMVYGPIAAFLVELFPTRIRYTSMSLPYHIGNGVFGGLLPTVATLLVTETHNHLAGLLYPIAIALVCFVIGVTGIKKNMISEE
ncbi:MFS transporter [Chitinophaga pinensis]|uniref:Major facilitator superfamily MFS_1 n=1 Tax=Chitinophaga pinensis (strain ATCC 43595 / DSM 2588 / LMG 13176 / NBRC 15968 / NCIMB 11800 / UQM 2034) TaxID=485918 RepID=A0A979GUK8_CHIPD|nr:MFS transporter [Chitinophaga pinensis]ACU60471.1 major facilitator superfamily MFS_1 [Chitinophaga pinensis DSM 2588]